MASPVAESSVFLGRGGTGEAYFVRPDAQTAVDYFAQLQAAQNRVKFDNQSANMRALDSIKAWSVDQPYFTGRRAGYIKKATDAMKGRYTNNPDYIGGINTEQDDIIAHAALSNETKANYDFNKKLYEQHPEQYPDNALEELDKYAKTPLEERDPTWTLPQLRDADFGKYYMSIKPPHYKAGEQVKNPDGTGYTAFSDTYKEKEGFDEALKLVSDPDSKMAIGLKKNLLMGSYPNEMGAMPEFKLLPYAEQQKILNSPQVNKAAATHVAETWKNMFPNTDKKVYDNQETVKNTNLGKSYADMVKEGVITEDYPVNTVVYEKNGKQSPGVTHVKDFMPLSMSKSTNVLSNNKFLDFDTNKYFSGEVGQYEFKPKGVGFIKDKKTGRYEAYSIGEATEINIGRRSKTVKTTYTNIAVPFNQVANAVAQDKNPIEWVQERSNELNKTNEKSDLTNVKDKAKGKTVVKKGYKRDANGKVTQTQLIYSDGTKETVNGQR